MNINKERSEIETKFFDLCKEVIAAEGLELYDIEYIEKDQLLRVTIINPATKSADLNDCVKVDRALTTPIESESWMPPELTLEVSSPGIFRTLTELSHFEMVIGEQVKILLFSKMEGERFPVKWRGEKKAIAQLLEVNEKEIIVSGPDGSSRVSFLFEEVKKVNLETAI